MVAKLLLILSLSMLLMSASSCPRKKGTYPAPLFEDCITLTQWDESLQIDTATSFCIDDRLDPKFFDNILVPKVQSKYNGHPLLPVVLQYLRENRDQIIKTKEYELPISYTRGYTQISPEDRTELTKWAEDNRVNRIKCEYNN